jgi:hypothetical protein
MIMAITTTQFRSLEKVRAEHDAVKEELRDLTIRRAKREVENPELFLYPDPHHGWLTEEIYKLRDRMGILTRELASAEGRLLTWACAEAFGADRKLDKEHKFCRGEFKCNGIWMKCGCECHQKKKGDQKK